MCYYDGNIGFSSKFFAFVSLKYGLKALDIQKKQPNAINSSFDYQAIANSYRGMGKYDLAELNYNKSYHFNLLNSIPTLHSPVPAASSL